jgi:hypothetical protein
MPHTGVHGRAEHRRCGEGRGGRTHWRFMPRIACARHFRTGSFMSTCAAWRRRRLDPADVLSRFCEHSGLRVSESPRHRRACRAVPVTDGAPPRSTPRNSLISSGRRPLRPARGGIAGAGAPPLTLRRPEPACRERALACGQKGREAAVHRVAVAVPAPRRVPRCRAVGALSGPRGRVRCGSPGGVRSLPGLLVRAQATPRDDTPIQLLIRCWSGLRSAGTTSM